MRLAEIVAMLDRWYDPAWAEPWDKVGLVCGDPDQEVARVLFAVDPVTAVVEEAVDWGADLVVVHHPLLLTPVSSVAADTVKGRIVHTLLRNGIALFTAHTNADVPTDGVNEAIARALALESVQVLGHADGSAMDKITVYAPVEAEDDLRDALVAAGAGAIGDYDSCTFTTPGVGRFRPLTGANPTIGEVGDHEVVEEVRIEAVLATHLREPVLAALRAAHPYEEPAFDLVRLANRARDESPEGALGHGRVGRMPAPTTLAQFAQQVAAALPATAHGVRVAGDPHRTVQTVAVGAGSGESLLEEAWAADADVFVTSDLKHHRASEFLEGGGPALVDVAHWAAEWTWLPIVAEKVADASEAAGDRLETRVSTTVTDPWTFRA